jgi:ribosomal protein L11 methyltransferase
VTRSRALDAAAVGVRLAPRITLLPVDAEPSASLGDQLILRVIPSRAFGDGSHPTTRLCARIVDAKCRAKTRVGVLDVGTGTGVLARIARAQGASFVVGTDIDAAAIESARANASLDEHALGIEFANAAPDAWGKRFDLVVANILSPVLLALAPALMGALDDDGVLVLSGFTRPEVPALRVAFQTRGLVVESEFVDGDWVALVFGRPLAPR